MAWTTEKESNRRRQSMESPKTLEGLSIKGNQGRSSAGVAHNRYIEHKIRQRTSWGKYIHHSIFKCCFLQIWVIHGSISLAKGRTFWLIGFLKGGTYSFPCWCSIIPLVRVLGGEKSYHGSISLCKRNNLLIDRLLEGGSDSFPCWCSINPQVWELFLAST